jgi:hypothetical protein
MVAPPYKLIIAGSHLLVNSDSMKCWVSHFPEAPKRVAFVENANYLNAGIIN